MKAKRPPIVTILGHVDHGKTTLLDSIRKSNIAAREVGGITQTIGASVVTTKDGKDITFIDTPGHAAFSKMRSRGANVADIAVLVVAANDGVKPQTKEALKYIREAKVPFLVAITKLDLKGVTSKSALEQLKGEGVKFEKSGGDTPYVELSGKTGKGIDDLLETISLLSEVNEVAGDKDADLEAVVIETTKGKGGNEVSVVVRSGTLKRGVQVFAGTLSAKVRAIFDDKGKGVNEVLPGYPGKVLGFDSLPKVGEVMGFSDTKETSPQVSSKQKEVAEGKVAVVLKAENAGIVEAVEGGLSEDIVVISSGVGDVNDSDVFLAKTSNALLVTLGTKTSRQIHNLAKTESVEVMEFAIIYKLFEALEEHVKSGKDEILGKAEILASFPYNKKKVAGSKVLEGRISKSDRLRLVRNEQEIVKMKAVSMRRGKEEIDTAKGGEEFGAIFAPQLDFEVGDVILSVK